MANIDIFLQQFDSKIATEIIEFGKRLSATKADVYILMARKAACLVHCMEDMNMISLDGFVTSERILDMDSSWLKGKSVIIIDDTVISGTTLFRTIEKLQKIEVLSISIYVLSVNKEHYVPELLQDFKGKSYLVEPFLSLENNECIKACSDIVNAVSIFPRPYDIDYPYFSKIAIEEEKYKRFIQLSNWTIDETTSYLQFTQNIFSSSFSPSDVIKKRFDEVVGFNLSDIAMMKIRVYGIKNEKKKSAYNLKVLPIVVFHPLKFESVDLLFKSTISEYDFNQNFENDFQTYTSKLRFLQYITASKLAQFWVKTELLSYNLQVTHDMFTLKLLFNERSINHILKIVENPDLTLVNEFATILVSLDGQKVRYHSNYNIVDHSIESIQLLLIEPFLRLYFNKERKAWEFVKKFKREVFNVPAFNDIMNRLKMGYSIPFLKHIISKYSEFDPSKVLSSFLDKSIDAGITVPIIVEGDNVVFRAYRHGEDVPFGEKEEKLCAITLDAFSKSLERKDFLQIWVEKLAVLLIKIGIQNKFLNPILSNVPPKESVNSKNDHLRTVASIRTYLYGPVVVYKSYEIGEKISHKPYIDPDEESSWLTKALLAKGILGLTKVKGKQQLVLKAIPNIILDKRLEGKAENIGLLFGLLLKRKLIDSHNDFVKLTACIYPEEVVSALSAEVNIFVKRWNNFETYLNSRLNQPNENLELINQLRKRRNLFFTAINSGQKKFFWFINKDGSKLIDQIAEELPDTLYKNIWSEFWSPNKDWTEESINKDLFKSITDQGLWLLSMNIYVRMLEFCLRRTARIEDSQPGLIEENGKELINCIEELKDYFSKINKFKDNRNTRWIIPFLSDFFEKEEFYQEVDIVALNQLMLSRIKSLNYISKSILENSELLINKFGKVVEIKRYSHTLFIGLDEPYFNMRNEVWSQIETFIENFRISLLDSVDSNDLIIRIPDEKNILNKGIWLTASGNTKSDLLINLANKIISKFSSRVNLKCVLFTQLSEDNRIKISIDNNTNIRYGYFWNKVEEFENFFLFTGNQHTELITILEDKNILIDEVSKLNVTESQFYNLIKQSTFESKDFTNTIYSVKRYQFMGTKNENADIGIITVVTEQTRSVLNYLNIDFADDKIYKGRSFYEKMIKLEANNETSKIVVTQQLEQGNRSVIPAYNSMVNQFHPKLIILLDIAGSINDDVQLCDVVLPNSVVYYENKKEVPNKTNRRGETFKLSPKIRQLINKFFIVNGEPAVLIATKNSIDDNFSVRQGPIGSGESVIADRASEIITWLTDFNSKTLAVEMESGGFMQAFYEDELTDERPEFGALIIRGISDHANVDKDDKWRIPAAENGTIVLNKFLKILSFNKNTD